METTRRVIDAHVHLDRFAERPGPGFDFFSPPRVEIITDEIVALMDANGVEKAVIMQHPNGALNDEASQAIADYPGRFRGAMILRYGDESCLSEMETNVRRGLTAIKLEMFGTTMYYPDFRLDSDLLLKVYAKAQELGVVITIDPFRIGLPSYQPDALEKVIPAFPDLKFVICHLGFPLANSHTEPGNDTMWRRMLHLAHFDNVWFDVTAMPDMFAGIETYPYPSAVALVRDFITTYGADKPMFGSDLPEELNRDGYDRLIGMFAGSDAFTEDEKSKLLHDNANRVYFGQA